MVDVSFGWGELLCLVLLCLLSRKSRDTTRQSMTIKFAKNVKFAKIVKLEKSVKFAKM